MLILIELKSKSTICFTKHSIWGKNANKTVFTNLYMYLPFYLYLVYLPVKHKIVGNTFQDLQSYTGTFIYIVTGILKMLNTILY